MLPDGAVPFPFDADASLVSAEWVARALSSGGRRVGGQLRAVESHQVGVGAGVFGDVTRLRLRYDHCPPGAPTSVILKMPSRSLVNRAQGIRFRMDEREIRFYREIAPGLRLRVPDCYWSVLDVGAGCSGLMLEDLGDIAADPRAGLRPERARVAVERLARAHAQWWEASGLAELTWLPSFADPLVRQVIDGYAGLWSVVANQHRDALPAGARDVGERIGEQLDPALEQLSRAPATLVHGDFSRGNLVCLPPGGVHPFAVVDWQLCGKGRGAFDVAYLLTQSMSIEHRRTHEADILRCWHRALERWGVAGYSYADAVADYRRSVVVSVAWAVTGAALHRSDERTQQLARAQAVRSLTAAVDLCSGRGVRT